MKKEMNIYAEYVEGSAHAQFMEAMKQDFVVKGALMPDTHTGYSLPIGAVIATEDAIVPAYVGYDIGCGVCALKVDGISVEDVEQHQKEIFDTIYETIPVGPNNNTKAIKYSTKGLSKTGIDLVESRNHEFVLGSLGGGNHFIEIGKDEKENIWIVIHSGSRSVGSSIAAHYMTVASSDPEKVAKEFDESEQAATLRKYNPKALEKAKEKFIDKKVGKLRPKEGHFSLDVNSKHGKDYIMDMNWALDFAVANRKEMIKRVVSAITKSVGLDKKQVDFSSLINRNHNHATIREIDGKNLWIHRKGATHAEEGMLGVIPGNMRDGSFIVRGKGNVDSLYSSSHGAGRVHSRKSAKENLDMKDFSETMKGIQAKVDMSTLDESPDAYKNIFDVMRQQEHLVEVIAHVQPLINIKG